MRLKSALLALSVLLGAATSCQKEDIKVQQPQAQSRTTADGMSSTSTCGPENKENKLDSVGVYHNLAMNFVAANSQQHTVSESVGLSNKYCITTFRQQVPDIDKLLPTEEQVRSLLSDTVTWFTKSIESSDLSRPCQDRLKKLISIMRENGSTGDYCQYKEAVLGFEQDVMHSDDLVPVERDQVLRAASIARYSFYHWTVEYNQSGGRSISGDRVQFLWFAAITIAVCDVAGGIFGGYQAAQIPNAGGVLITAGVIAGAAGASGSVAGIFGLFNGGRIGR